MSTSDRPPPSTSDPFAGLLAPEPRTQAQVDRDARQFARLVRKPPDLRKANRPKCGARCRTRGGAPCRAPCALRPDGSIAPRCRMHGGLAGAMTPEQKERASENFALARQASIAARKVRAEERAAALERAPRPPPETSAERGPRPIRSSAYAGGFRGRPFWGPRR